MLQIAPFFAVPFGIDKLDDCAGLNADLRELFVKLAAAGSAYANPRPLTQRPSQVFESRFDLFKWPEPCVQRVKSFCLENVLRLVRELNRYDDAMMQRLVILHDSWFHITRRGGFFALHNHPMASWSGVYCVATGRHDEDRPDSGLLSFLNPAVFGAMYLDASTASIRGPFSYNIRHLRQEPGQLVLFPSWLLHDVKPFEGDGERITISFNCWFSLRNA